MKKLYTIRVTETHSGLVEVLAEDFEQAEEIAFDIVETHYDSLQGVCCESVREVDPNGEH